MPAGERPHRGWAIAVAAAALVAATLRLVALRRVPDNPFYDAAVRSMSHSLHNFIYGAFEPGGSASIDKPPIDLWLQVATVKLVGFSSTSLKLPAALSGTLAVPLLYDLVRRVATRAAALASAVTLALMPVSVIAARSDTMDSVMMALLVASAWLLLRAAERRSMRLLLLAAAVLGLDFNVKLFEALVPLPALLAFAWFSARGTSVPAALRRLGAAASVFAVVALSWLVVVTLTPRHERPYPIGSTNGSAWNAVFVFNGIDRVTQPAQPPAPDASPLSGTLLAATKPLPGTLRPVRHRHRSRPVTAPAGPLRLFKRSRVDFGGLIGTVLFAALAFGALAALRARRWLRRPPPGSELARAAAIGAGIWLLVGYVLFSFAGRAHPRYLESFTPAVAATLGVALTQCVRAARDRLGALALAGVLWLSIAEAATTTGNGTLVTLGLGVGVGIAIAATAVLWLAAVAEKRSGGRPAWSAPDTLAAMALAALLAFPLARDARIIREHSGVQAATPELRPTLVVALSDYLRAHQGSARYEVAASAPSVVAQLVVRDARPILLLTTLNARALVTLPALRRAIDAGEVHYVLTRGRCPIPPYHLLPACSAAVRWAMANGVDVTARLGVAEQSGLLFDVSGTGSTATGRPGSAGRAR